MDPITPFDWRRLFFGLEPPLYFLEIVFRVILIYGFTVFMLRFTGKRGQRQMTSFELVLVIALGSATGDSMFYPEVPILYAWLIIFVMVCLNQLLNVLQVKYKGINDFLEGKPRMLIEKGIILNENLKEENLRRDEFMGLLREQEVKDTGEVEYAYLELSGQLGIIRRDKEEQLEVESTSPFSEHIQ